MATKLKKIKHHGFRKMLLSMITSGTAKGGTGGFTPVRLHPSQFPKGNIIQYFPDSTMLYHNMIIPGEISTMGPQSVSVKASDEVTRGLAQV